jgi:1-acyl-sn-glycerol-3-phosphate acyltransferase
MWLQGSAQAILKVLDIKTVVEGQPPMCGLVVSNHLSYLDIIIISAAMPCFFVSKIEVGDWPFFGKAARSGGTIFLDRSSRDSANAVAEQMTARLKLPIPVLLFPEGTSTDGSQVLRFHSRLIDPATAAGVPITAAAIQYIVGGGVEERELCWFGASGFTGHLWKVLGVKSFAARLHFGQSRVYSDRRVAADQTHDEIVAWREAGTLDASGTLAPQLR